jgi:hypothetical protein
MEQKLITKIYPYKSIIPCNFAKFLKKEKSKNMNTVKVAINGFGPYWPFGVSPDL